MFKMINHEKSTFSFNYAYGEPYLNNYNITKEDGDASLWMEVCSPNSSEWWRALPNSLNIFKPQEMFEWMREKNLNASGIKTAETKRPTMKACPGILGLFKSTILLKAPANITIYIQDNPDGNHSVINQSELPNLLPIQLHSTNQFANMGSSWGQYRNLKFCFPFRVRSTHPYIFAQPYWHNKLPFDVPPGGIFGKFTEHQDLNLNTLYKMKPDLEYNEINIKKGTVLGYIIFPYPVKLKYDENIPQNVRLSQIKSGTCI